MIKVSPHFTLTELCKSKYSTPVYPNTPPCNVVICLTHLCVYVLEPLRSLLNQPLIVNSGYRSPDINRMVGGAVTSQHLYGQAVDLHFRDPKSVADKIDFNRMIYDQMIVHKNYLHISFDPFGRNRHQRYELD